MVMVSNTDVWYCEVLKTLCISTISKKKLDPQQCCQEYLNWLVIRNRKPLCHAVREDDQGKVVKVSKTTTHGGGYVIKGVNFSDYWFAMVGIGLIFISMILICDCMTANLLLLFELSLLISFFLYRCTSRLRNFISYCVGIGVLCTNIWCLYGPAMHWTGFWRWEFT